MRNWNGRLTNLICLKISQYFLRYFFFSFFKYLRFVKTRFISELNLTHFSNFGLIKSFAGLIFNCYLHLEIVLSRFFFSLRYEILKRTKRKIRSYPVCKFKITHIPYKNRKFRNNYLVDHSHLQLNWLCTGTINELKSNCKLMIVREVFNTTSFVYITRILM